MPTYQVRPGDSWARIAGLFGSQREYQLWQQANRGIDVLKSGMVLNVPGGAGHNPNIGISQQSWDAANKGSTTTPVASIGGFRDANGNIIPLNAAPVMRLRDANGNILTTAPTTTTPTTPVAPLTTTPPSMVTPTFHPSVVSAIPNTNIISGGANLKPEWNGAGTYQPGPGFSSPVVKTQSGAVGKINGARTNTSAPVYNTDFNPSVPNRMGTNAGSVGGSSTFQIPTPKTQPQFTSVSGSENIAGRYNRNYRSVSRNENVAGYYNNGGVPGTPSSSVSTPPAIVAPPPTMPGGIGYYNGYSGGGSNGGSTYTKPTLYWQQPRGGGSGYSSGGYGRSVASQTADFTSNFGLIHWRF